MNLNNIKNQFPIFSKKINGKSLVYLDNSNSSQKPVSVLNKLDEFYRYEFSNVGRSIHSLAVKATNKYDETRVSIKNFINAQSKDEIIFTKNATESINLVASTFMKGACASVARRREISVLPTPVGPIIKIFLGNTSSRIVSSSCWRRHLLRSAMATARFASCCPII